MPTFFCTTTETARDVVDHYFFTKKKEPPHKSKDLMMDVDWDPLPPLLKVNNETRDWF